MKKSVMSESTPSPVVRHRLAEMLDALSAECLELAHDARAEVADYERVLSDIETLAEVLREWELHEPGERKTEWTLSDRVKDAMVKKTIASAARMRAANEQHPEQSGERPTLSLAEAYRTIDELHEEDSLRSSVDEVQRALA